jgi:hypothetical protein
MAMRLTDISKTKTMLGVVGLTIIAGVAIYEVSSANRLVAHGGGLVRDGQVGFVVTQFAYAVGTDGNDVSCPAGMSKNIAEIFGETPEGERTSVETDEAYSKRQEAGGKAMSNAPDGRNYCMNPEIAPIDTHARTLTHIAAKANGLNLDGKISRSKADVVSGRFDFDGVDGTKGVDNQFWRAVGCNHSFQSNAQSNGFGSEMYTGSWGILLTLSGVDDLKNDDEVEVGIYANADPMQVSPTRKALEYATYAMDQDAKYRTRSAGRIKDGVLTTQPVDIRVRKVTNALYLDRTLRDARIQAKLSPHGVLKGYLAGYSPVDSIYDLQFGFRNATDADGKLAPLLRRIGTSNGAARVLGHTCQGIWQSLNRMADGHPDPKTGTFTSISTQYVFEARPAFVVDVDTRKAKFAAKAPGEIK